MAEAPARRTPPPNESEGQRINRELAEAAAEAEARNADEFPEEDGYEVAASDGRGTATAYGRFMVDGVLVDSEGRPIKDKKD